MNLLEHLPAILVYCSYDMLHASYLLSTCTLCLSHMHNINCINMRTMSYMHKCLNTLSPSEGHVHVHVSSTRQYFKTCDGKSDLTRTYKTLHSGVVLQVALFTLFSMEGICIQIHMLYKCIMNSSVKSTSLLMIHLYVTTYIHVPGSHVPLKKCKLLIHHSFDIP